MKRFLFAGTLLAALSLLVMVTGPGANPLWLGYFELLDQPYSTAIPAHGSQWQAVAAADGGGGGGGHIVDQVEFQDEGDGLVSAGDKILGPSINGERDLINVVSVRRIYRLEGSDRVLRPIVENPSDPIGETWEVIYPDHEWGTLLQVEDWAFPSAPAGAREGDLVQLEGVWYMVVQVRLCVEGSYATPVRSTTWGKIKTFFGDML